jgi:dipeptidyl aminopeptidase/acylaminoacyl peptidase
MGLFDRFLQKPAAGPLWSVQLGDHPVGIGFAEGGKQIVVGTGSGAVHLLDAARGETAKTIAVHDAGMLALTVSPNGKLACTGGMNARAEILDLSRGESIASCAADADWVDHVAFSPTGAHVALAAGKHARIHAIDGAHVATLGPHASTVAGIAWSPDGTRLGVARYGGADLWKLDGKKERELAWKSSLVSLAWQPKDRFLAAGCQDNAVHFWRLDVDKDSMMGGYPGKPKQLAWSSDGASLATGGGEEIVVWSFRGQGPEGSSPRMLKAHTKAVTTIVAAHGDQRIASGGRDGLFCVWRPQRSETPVLTHAMSAPVEHLAFRGDDTHCVVTDQKGQVALFKLP